MNSIYINKMVLEHLRIRIIERNEEPDKSQMI
jgi:hypothetical protein